METSLKDEAPMKISAPLWTVSLSAVGKTDEFLDVISCDDLQLFVPIKTVKAQLLFFVELAFILMFRFQRKPTQLDELQRKETTSQWQRTQCSTEDKRRLICGLYQRLLRVSTIFFKSQSNSNSFHTINIFLHQKGSVSIMIRFQNSPVFRLFS